MLNLVSWHFLILPTWKVKYLWVRRPEPRFGFWFWNWTMRGWQLSYYLWVLTSLKALLGIECLSLSWQADVLTQWYHIEKFLSTQNSNGGNIHNNASIVNCSEIQPLSNVVDQQNSCDSWGKEAPDPAKPDAATVSAISPEVAVIPSGWGPVEKDEHATPMLHHPPAWRQAAWATLTCFQSPGSLLSLKFSSSFLLLEY